MRNVTSIIHNFEVTIKLIVTLHVLTTYNKYWKSLDHGSFRVRRHKQHEWRHIINKASWFCWAFIGLYCNLIEYCTHHRRYSWGREHKHWLPFCWVGMKHRKFYCLIPSNRKNAKKIFKNVKTYSFIQYCVIVMWSEKKSGQQCLTCSLAQLKW